MLGILEYIHRYYNANYMPFLLNLVRKIGFITEVISIRMKIFNLSLRSISVNDPSAHSMCPKPLRSDPRMTLAGIGSICRPF